MKINKKAQLRLNRQLYLACRGVYRVKVAETTPAATDKPATAATNTTTTNTQQEAPIYNARYGMRDAGRNIMEQMTGTNRYNSYGAAAADFAATAARNGVTLGAEAMSNYKGRGAGWINPIGNFLKNEENRNNFGNIIGFVSRPFMDWWRQDMRADRINNALQEKTKKMEEESYDPSSAFTSMFQTMAYGGGNPMPYQGYGTQNYTPSYM